jgi:hypothetical protein
MDAKSCLRCILGLPSESEMHDALSVHCVGDVAWLIAEYADDDVVTLARIMVIVTRNQKSLQNFGN